MGSGCQCTKLLISGQMVQRPEFKFMLQGARFSPSKTLYTEILRAQALAQLLGWPYRCHGAPLGTRISKIKEFECKVAIILLDVRISG